MLLTFIICYVVDAIIDVKKYTDFFVLPGYKVPIFILITISILLLYLKIYYSKIKYLYCTLLILCVLGVFYDGYLFFIGLAGFLDLKKVDADSKRSPHDNVG